MAVAFQQAIPHTGTAITNGHLAGHVIVDRTTCCRGFHRQMFLEWNLNGSQTLNRSLLYEGHASLPECGTTAEGPKVYKTGGGIGPPTITPSCYTFRIVSQGEDSLNQQTGEFSIAGSGNVTGGLVGSASLTVNGTLTDDSPLTGVYDGNVTGDVVGTFDGTIAGSGGTTTYDLSVPANSLASGVFKFTYPSDTETFAGSHTGSGTITGATFSGSGTGTLTGDYSGAYALTINGNLTSPDPDGDFEGDFTGAIVGHFEGTIVNGVLTVTSHTLSAPENGFITSFNPSLTITSPTTFDFSGNFSGNVKYIRYNVTVSGLGGAVKLYEHLTISSCERGGAVLEVRRVSDDVAIATYNNAHHGLWENQGTTDLYLASTIGCLDGLCPWKIYSGNGGWPQVVGLRLSYNKFGTTINANCEGVTVAPGSMKATLSPDGSGLGAELDGFVANNNGGCSVSESGDVQTLVPAGTFDFTDANRISVPGFESVEYEEVGTITVVQGVAPDDYRFGLGSRLKSYGIMTAFASLTLRGRLQMDRTRVVGGGVDSVNLVAIALSATYVGQSDDICDGCVMTLAYESFSIGAGNIFPTATPLQVPAISLKAGYPPPFPMNSSIAYPFRLSFWLTASMFPTTCTVEPI